ncbi:hypothetical protein Aperf_G00000121047 [Anoplocephala perfoliata]
MLSAQKCSVEAALREAQITSERDLKRARMENRSLESEKAELISHSRTLERRLTESTEINDSLKRQLQQAQSEADERVENILKAYKQEESLNEKIDQLKAEADDLRVQLDAKQKESCNLRVEMEVLRSSVTVTEKKLEALQSLWDENLVVLKDAEMLKANVAKFESENARLRDQLEQISHGPGNASSLLSRPDGSGLCLRSSSLLHSTRLEQTVVRLKSENAELRHSEAQLVTARAELEDLKASLARANEWRDRALLAEGKLANQCASTLKESLEGTRATLAQCQRENALLLSENGNLRSELLAASIELKNAKLEISAQSEEEKRLRTASECMESRIRRQKLRLTILEKERDLYKQFVESYADADAILASPAGDLIQEFRQMTREVVGSLNECHRQLESDDAELERLSSEISSLARETQMPFSVAEISSADLALSASDRRIAEQLRETIRKLEERIEQLESAKQAADEEIALMRAEGAYNPNETQVIHLIDNPTQRTWSQREDELISLRKENALLQQRAKFLRERLDRLYELNSQGCPSGPESGLAPGDVTTAVAESLNDHPDPISEIRRLQAERQAEDRRQQKLMERFGELSSEFREACALIFGFGLYVRQSGIYKVVPLHTPFDAATYSQSSKATEFIKFRRTGDTITVMATTLRDEVATDFANCRLPIPLALARLLLLVNGDLLVELSSDL